MVENNDKLLRTITVSDDFPEELDNYCIAKGEPEEIVTKPDIDDELIEHQEDPTADDDIEMNVANFEEIQAPAPLAENTSKPTIIQAGSQPVLRCPVEGCDKEFIGFKLFEAHCITHVVSKVRSYQQLVSHPGYLPSSFLSPLQNIVCPICQCPYERTESFRNHMYVHMNQMFQCPHCDRLCSRPKTLHDHIRDAHLQYARKGLDELLREEELVLQQAVAIPGTSGKDKKSRKRRAAAVDNAEDEEEEASGSPVNDFSDAFMNSIKQSAMNCPVCGRSCDSYKSFEEHIFTHISRLNRSCPLCQQQFKRFDNLKCHMYSHTDITFKCGNCPKEFVNPKTYSKHVREFHLNKLEQPHDIKETCCAYCGKSFTQSGTLREHLKIHTLEKKYPCTVCGDKFAMKVTLREHVSEKHPNSLPVKESVPTECPLCRKVFPSKKERNAHIEEGHPTEPGLCTICGEFTGSAQELKGHMIKKHSETDPTGTVFKCKECNKSFTKVSGMSSYLVVASRPFFSFVQAFRLKDHQKSHNRERRFPCDICGFAFISLGNLEAHIRSQHKIAV